MRFHHPALYATAFAVLALSVAGCGSDSPQTPPPGQLPSNLQSVVSDLLKPLSSIPDPPTTSSSPPERPCLVGRWIGTGYVIAGGAMAETSGKFSLVISPDGDAVADFGGPDPFKTTVTWPFPRMTEQDHPTDADLSYRGKVEAKLTIPPGIGWNGEWQPSPGIDWSTLHLTVGTAAKKLVDDTPLSDFHATSGVPGADTAEPLMSAGKFSCNMAQMSVEQVVGRYRLTWSFDRDLS